MSIVDRIRKTFGPPQVVQRETAVGGFPPSTSVMAGAVVVGNLIFDGEDTSIADRIAYSAMPFWVRNAARRGSEQE